MSRAHAGAPREAWRHTIARSSVGQALASGCPAKRVCASRRATRTRLAAAPGPTVPRSGRCAPRACARSSAPGSRLLGPSTRTSTSRPTQRWLAALLDRVLARLQPGEPLELRVARGSRSPSAAAAVPGRARVGERVDRVEADLVEQASSVCSKSASVSVGKPTMTSVPKRISGMRRRSPRDLRRDSPRGRSRAASRAAPRLRAGLHGEVEVRDRAPAAASAIASISGRSSAPGATS